MALIGVSFLVMEDFILSDFGRTNISVSKTGRSGVGRIVTGLQVRGFFFGVHALCQVLTVFSPRLA